MKEISEICSMIGLQQQITKEVIDYNNNFNYSEINSSINKLFKRSSWNAGRKEIKASLGEDHDGIKILTCMIHSAQQSYEMYKAKGIDEKIFIDTMKCFTRFIDEHKNGYGTLEFDRDWWTARQIALQLFRIGELEYEMNEKDGEKVINIHIPSDAVFTVEECMKSYKMAEKFFAKYYSEYRNVDYVCSSWLLSPELKRLLSADSNILLFQNQFDIKDVDSDDMEFLQWVYKRDKIPYKLLPEDTILQKNMKKHLLNGGKIGSAFGVLKDYR